MCTCSDSDVQQYQHTMTSTTSSSHSSLALGLLILIAWPSVPRYVSCVQEWCTREWCTQVMYERQHPTTERILSYFIWLALCTLRDVPLRQDWRAQGETLWGQRCSLWTQWSWGMSKARAKGTSDVRVECHLETTQGHRSMRKETTQAVNTTRQID